MATQVTKPAIHPLTQAAHGAELTVLEPTPEQSGRFETIWAALPSMRAAPPFLQVDLESCTNNTDSSFHYKTWVPTEHR